jgi:hypothetical protein
MRKAGIITILCIFIFAIVSVIGVSCGADTRTVIKKAACESKHIKAYTEVVTDYEYKFDWLHGKYRLVPNTHTVKHKDEYKLMYRTIYDDLTGKTEWVTVSKAEYDAYKAQENRGG